MRIIQVDFVRLMGKNDIKKKNYSVMEKNHGTTRTIYIDTPAVRHRAGMLLT